jgi:hypothetical protein
MVNTQNHPPRIQDKSFNETLIIPNTSKNPKFNMDFVEVDLCGVF